MAHFRHSLFLRSRNKLWDDSFDNLRIRTSGEIRQQVITGVRNRIVPLTRGQIHRQIRIGIMTKQQIRDQVRAQVGAQVRDAK